MGGAGAGGAAAGGAPTGGASTGGASMGGASTGGAGGSGGAGAEGGGGSEPCVLDAGEGCEDCNEDPNDGCTGNVVDVGFNCEGAVAPQLCAALSTVVLGGPIQTTTPFGTNGGSPGEMLCPSGQVAVGLEFDFDGAPTTTRVRAVRLRCASLSISGGGKVGWTSASAVNDDFGGGSFSSEVTNDCMMSQFLVGARLTRDNDPIRSVALRCGELALQGDTLVVGPITELSAQGEVSAQVFVADCAQPSDVVVGIRGREGGRIDQWIFDCAPLVPGFCGDGVVTEPEDCDDPLDASCVDCTD